MSQFIHFPKEAHLKVVHRVHYLNATLRKGILFKKNEKLNLEAYTGVDWVGSSIKVVW